MLERLYKALDWVLEYLGIIFTIIMCAAIFLQIIWRYIFNNPMAWPEEVGRYMFCWSTYIAISICMKGDRHLRMPIFLDMLNADAKKIVNIIVQIINTLFFCISNIFHNHDDN